jgi:dTDP-4-dehydrorhamnose 3,5-epimerase
MDLVDYTKPSIIEGKKAVDDRGSVAFVNDFSPYVYGVKRFYQVQNHRAGFIRAWHGHEKECKFVYVVRGTAIVKVANMKEAGDYVDEGLVGKSPITSYVLSADCPRVLFIPNGFYNGFKTLTEDTIIQFFSTSTVEESVGDDFRVPWDNLGKAVWAEDYR